MSPAIFRWFYSLVLTLLFLFYLPFLLIRAAWRREDVASFVQRLGFLPRLPRPSGRRIWIHAVSVGEFLAVRPLLRQLKHENFSLVISTTTTAANQLAKQHCADVAEAIIFFPFDFSFCVRRSLNAIRPNFFIMVETEIWPNFIGNCARRGIPMLMANGRISDRSFVRYQFVRPLLAPSLLQVQRFCMQTQEDAHRLIQLGALPSRVRVTGNLKYDVEPQRRPERLNQLIREVLGTGSKVPLLVAGSTAEGEEVMLLDMLCHIRERIPLKMVIAPRSPRRFEDVANLLSKEQWSLMRRSFFSDLDLDHPLRSEVRYDIFLLDSIGELTGVYEMATVVFVGKSLVPGGGQNILEPAYFGKPILFGPYMENFREVADNFLRRRAAIQVRNLTDLTKQLLRLLQNCELRSSLGSNARKIISDNRGAAGNTMHQIRELLGRQQSSAISHRSDE
ncbi:MAG: 3-deoxy-D-manno-octulosonic acid transferase [Acidobacteria bacterium]|nr:3-deoxy-D-manno-octulosonic acid transferase [Acidobacteriota bacterium]